ncbi:hypothetical protein BDW62DRAFT_212399 [Aspergillus aurantiobrunneus]
MAPSDPAVKRSFSSFSEMPIEPESKRVKRPYRHHHRLRQPVTSSLSEPAIADESYVDQIMSRIIGQSLQSSGFDIADPLAVESFRDAAEEYLLRLASYVRASMLSSRRIQPIPHDFEYALKRHSLPVDSLLPYLQLPQNAEPIPTQLLSPPPEDEDDFKILPSLEPHLSGENDRARSAYIPKHFPDFPSKHTYRHTPVFTDRERDPRKIRERAADDGRHGEEALRKLARAAFKDNQPGSGGRDKKQWSRRAESFETMFEKTVKGLSKKAPKNGASSSSTATEIDSSAATETEAKPGRSKGLAGMELPPIINCERGFWRRSGRQRPEEKPSASLFRFASSSACRIGSHEVVSTVNPPAHLGKVSSFAHHRFADHNSRLWNTVLRRIARVLYHFQEVAFLELYRAALAALFLKVLVHDVDMIREFFGREDGNERCHWWRFGEKLLLGVHEEGLDELLHDLRVLHRENSQNTRTRFGVAPIDELLEVFWPAPRPLRNLPGIEENIASEHADYISTAEHGPTHFEVPVQPVFHSRPYPVLEISSTSPAAGKSQVLYYLSALAVLPHEFNGISLDGFDSTVVFIDTDGRFDAERLRTVARGIVRSKLLARAETSSPDPSLDDAFETMLLASMQHVHVFRPQSSSALLATLQSLDTYLLNIPLHVSSNRALQAIYIDSATAFFWQDKLRNEIARTEDIGRSVADIERERRQKESFHLADIHADLVASLKRLQHVFDCAVIYTTTSFSGKPTERSSVPHGSYNPLDTALRAPSFRSPLPPPWGLFPTLRLVLQREVVRPFPPSVTVHEARRDAPMRQEVVMRGEFLGSVNGWGREDWPQRILEELKRRDGGQFTFNAGRDGVTFS